MDKMKTVLMIAHQFPPTNFSGTARPFYFAKHLSELGYHPRVLTVRAMSKYEVDDKLATELGGCCDVCRLDPWGDGVGGITFKRLLRCMEAPFHLLPGLANMTSAPPVWLPVNIWSRFCEGAASWVWPGMVLGLKVFFRSGFDIIWATGPPWDSLSLGYWLSRLTGRPLVVDIRDPWTYGYGTLWKRKAPKVMRRQRKWERMVLSKAARIAYTSPLTTQIMRKRVADGISRRMVTITNGFAEQARFPMRDVSDTKCLFRYVGNLGKTYRRPDVLFRAFILASRDCGFKQDARLQFIGGMDEFEKDIDRYGLRENVDYLGYKSQADSLSYMRGADVLVLLQTIAGAGKDAISGKVYEYLAAGKPILAVVPDDGGDAWLVRHTESGVVTGMDDPVRVADGLRHYWALWKQNKLSAAAPEGDIERFSRRNLTRQLAALFDEVLHEQQGSR